MAVTVFGGSLRIWITVSFSSSFRMQQLPLCSAVEKSRNYTWPFCSFQYNQQYKCLIFFRIYHHSVLLFVAKDTHKHNDTY